jgi:DUF4097 and DUF4098 domain-containing protein YvlB
MPVRTALAAALCLALAAPAAFAQVRDIEKVNGSITAEAGQRFGQLETVNGSIHVEAGAQTASAETVNGAIRVEQNARTGSLETVNGSIRVEAGVEMGGSVTTVNGSIFVDRGGRVGGGVETVNGAIGLVDTDVAGGIETVNGNVTVGIGSHVRGGLHYEKPSVQWLSISKRRPPRVVIGPGARVDGPLVFEREVELYVHASAHTGPISGATAIRYSTPQPPR